MKAVYVHPTYGEIVYQESFWTGKKSMTVNGMVATPKSKTEFVVYLPEGECELAVRGGYVGKVELTVNGEVVQLVPPAKWYEVLLSTLIFGIAVAFGNVPFLAALLPLAGGAIGGAVSGMMAFLTLLFMKSQKTTVNKLLVWAGMLAGTVAVLHVLEITLLVLLY